MPEPVTSPRGELNNRDWRVVGKQAWYFFLAAVGSTAFLTALGQFRPTPGSLTQLGILLLMTVGQWARYRQKMPPSLQPMDGEVPDFRYSHQRPATPPTETDDTRNHG